MRSKRGGLRLSSGSFLTVGYIHGTLAFIQGDANISRYGNVVFVTVTFKVRGASTSTSVFVVESFLTIKCDV